MEKRINLCLVLLTIIGIFVARTIGAQEAPQPIPKGPAVKLYSGDFDPVWEKIVEVLTEKGLSEHPHGKMSMDKDAGKITTPTFRYFKIYSAKPVKETDYRDSYIVLVSKTSGTSETAPPAGEGNSETAKSASRNKSKMTKVEIQRKFEVYDDEKKRWVDGDPSSEKVGITEDALFSAIDAKLAK